MLYPNKFALWIRVYEQLIFITINSLIHNFYG